MIVNLSHALVEGKLLRIECSDCLDTVHVLGHEAVQAADGGGGEPAKKAGNSNVGAENEAKHNDKWNNCQGVGGKGIHNQKEGAK